MCIYLCVCAYVCMYTYMCVYICEHMYVYMKEIHQDVNSGYFWMVAFSTFSVIRKLLLLATAKTKTKTNPNVIFKG